MLTHWGVPGGSFPGGHPVEALLKGTDSCGEALNETNKQKQQILTINKKTKQQRKTKQTNKQKNPSKQNQPTDVECEADTAYTAAEQETLSPRLICKCSLVNWLSQLSAKSPCIIYKGWDSLP